MKHSFDSFSSYIHDSAPSASNVSCRQSPLIMTISQATSYPKSPGSLTSGLSPGETLEYWNFITAGFLR